MPAMELLTRILAMGLATFGLFTDSATRVAFAILMWMSADTAAGWIEKENR